jgi:hypothetical protein
LVGGVFGAGTVYFYATSAAIVTTVAVTSTLTLEGGRVFASNDAAAMVTDARTVADGGIDCPPHGQVSPHAASVMLKKRIVIKTDPRILVFRRNTRYYTRCGLSVDSLTFIIRRV